MTDKQKIHIFHVVNSLQIGGLEQVVVNIINGLDPGRYRHSVCCIDKIGPMAERLEYPVTILNLNKGTKVDRLVPFKIASLIRHDTPHIVHTRNWSAIDGIWGARLAGVKAIVHDEHGRGSDDPEGKNWKRNIVRRFLSRWVSVHVAVSDELEQWFYSQVGISAAKVMKIINGVDLKHFKPDKNKAEARKKMADLGLPSNSFVVGFVGRLDPVKDLDTLLKGFAYVCDLIEVGFEPRLLIVGGGVLMQQLEDKARELGIADKVVFTGPRSDISELMQCMDVFCLTSIAEGLPMTVLEAMATGIPVVATQVGGLGELITHGETGYLVSAKDHAALGNYLSVYASGRELVAAHGTNSRHRAEQEFSLSGMVATYDGLYRSLAGLDG